MTYKSYMVEFLSQHLLLKNPYEIFLISNKVKLITVKIAHWFLFSHVKRSLNLKKREIKNKEINSI